MPALLFRISCWGAYESSRWGCMWYTHTHTDMQLVTLRSIYLRIEICLCLAGITDNLQKARTGMLREEATLEKGALRCTPLKNNEAIAGFRKWNRNDADMSFWISAPMTTHPCKSILTLVVSKKLASEWAHRATSQGKVQAWLLTKLGPRLPATPPPGSSASHILSEPWLRPPNYFM